MGLKDMCHRCPEVVAGGMLISPGDPNISEWVGQSSVSARIARRIHHQGELYYVKRIIRDIESAARHGVELVPGDPALDFTSLLGTLHDHLTCTARHHGFQLRSAIARWSLRRTDVLIGYIGYGNRDAHRNAQKEIETMVKDAVARKGLCSFAVFVSQNNP